MKEFVWLHIKKSGGMSTRQVLKPHYRVVDREKQPYTFVQAETDEYNDILNNFRVPLGQYQFRRCLFARDVLYKEKWNDMLSFAFSRNPEDRCVSAFFYLWHKKGWRSFAKRNIVSYEKRGTLCVGLDYSFSCYLDLVEMSFNSKSIYEPIDLHFATHAARMWPDISDRMGNMLLSKVFRLDDLAAGAQYVFDRCGIDECAEKKMTYVNKGRDRLKFRPKHYHKRKLEKLYAEDFEIFEGMCTAV